MRMDAHIHRCNRVAAESHPGGGGGGSKGKNEERGPGQCHGRGWRGGGGRALAVGRRGAAFRASSTGSESRSCSAAWATPGWRLRSKQSSDLVDDWVLKISYRIFGLEKIKTAACFAVRKLVGEPLRSSPGVGCWQSYRRVCRLLKNNPHTAASFFCRVLLDTNKKGFPPVNARQSRGSKLL